jgi:hypothetical protein
MPLQRTRSRALLGRSPLNGGSLGTRMSQRGYGQVVFLLLASVASGCDPCGNSPIARLPSPSGRMEAIVFTRDCGATTDFSTQVSLVKSGASLPTAGANLFSSDANHGKASRGPGGGPNVTVRWLSDDMLEVSYQSGTRVFRREPSLDGIRVQYVQR